MNSIYRVPANTDTVLPGEDWNALLASLESITSDRLTAVKRGAEYVLHAALLEGQNPDLASVADGFIESTQPPLTKAEETVFKMTLGRVSVTQEAVKATITRRENIVARREEISE